ncbi:DUF58 domain-containing protein [Deinococcus yavapaiensis]|uniref:Uncharacterized protein DUF58 n=1 Tax=Deinococcus yavapaiensis KR-236 TaxID=694435 RepID=A0A318SBR2_9DEIO|nr:DUF58 domain-containing protein [Deinococcus yavapaiensis]PYE56488.1 uncharacterized protein DUF58 [Deinococcus yavapaiensis KR-236]
MNDPFAVKPTRFGLSFLGLVAAMLIGCINYGLSLGYFLTFLLTGLWAACGVAALRALPGLHVDVADPPAVFAGEEARVPIVLNGGGRERPDVDVALRGARIRVDVPARGDVRADVLVKVERRGRANLGRVEVRGGDPIGFFEARVRHDEDVTVLVYPAPERGAPPLPRGAGSGEGGGTRVAGNEDFHSLRPYVPGDAPTRVSWRHAARSQGPLVVRTFDANGGGAALLDFTALRSLGAEARLSRLCAWLLRAERENVVFELRLPGVAVVRGQGAAITRRGLVALATFEERADA